MTDPAFAPINQSFDIPKKIRISFYVAADQLNYDFDAPQIDNKLLKTIADGPYDKAVRAQLIRAKLNGELSFDLVPAGPCIQPLESFLQYLQIEEEAQDMLLQARHMVEVTAVEPLDQAMAGMKIVHLGAALLALELNGLLIEPYSLKIYSAENQILGQLQQIELGTPPLAPFLSVIQSKLGGQKTLTTTHGLSRFGLPDFAVKSENSVFDRAICYLLRGLAQSFLSSVLEAKEQNLDRFSVKYGVKLTYEDLLKGNLTAPQKGSRRKTGAKQKKMMFEPTFDKSFASQTVPLRLKRRGSGQTYLSLAFHGRSQDKSQALAKLLQDVGLLPAEPMVEPPPQPPS